MKRIARNKVREQMTGERKEKKEAAAAVVRNGGRPAGPSFQGAEAVSTAGVGMVAARIGGRVVCVDGRTPLPSAVALTRDAAVGAARRSGWVCVCGRGMGADPVALVDVDTNRMCARGALICAACWHEAVARVRMRSTAEKGAPANPLDAETA